MYKYIHIPKPKPEIKEYNLKDYIIHIDYGIGRDKQGITFLDDKGNIHHKIIKE